jgi:large subunit ribosomal protein L15
VGRGHGSGRGKTAGRGTKGQKARAGGGIPAWFEGGQTPLHVRTPKLHGFKNRFRVEYRVINLAQLSEAEKGVLITPDTLSHDQLVRDQKTRQMPLKILGTGDAPKGVTIHAHAFTRTAREKLEAAGSTVQLLSWPDNDPVDEAAEAEAAQAEAEAEAVRSEAKVAKAEARAEAAAAAAEAADPGAAAADDDGDAPRRESRAEAEADGAETKTETANDDAPEESES